MTEAELRPIVEVLIYLAEEPISENVLLELLGKEHRDQIRMVLLQITSHYAASECGIEIKEIAGGYKMATKPEYHEWVRKYVKHLTPPTRLSLAALETLAVIAYKQPITLPEIQDVRGVNAGAVMKTLIDKKLVTTAGRKTVIGRPILYKTTKEFLLQFGLKDLRELPSLEEFEELAQASLGAENLSYAPGVESEGFDPAFEALSREETLEPDTAGSIGILGESLSPAGTGRVEEDTLSPIPRPQELGEVVNNLRVGSAAGDLVENQLRDTALSPESLDTGQVQSTAQSGLDEVPAGKGEN